MEKDVFVPKKTEFTRFKVGDVVELTENSKIDTPVGTWTSPHRFRVEDVDDHYVTIVDCENKSHRLTLFISTYFDGLKVVRDFNVVK